MDTSTPSTMPSGYVLHDGYPAMSDYLHLRSITGLTPKTPSQARAIPGGSWYGCFIRCEEDNATVAMGRIIGDGGWYFHIADMAVHPDHQRKGLGDQLMKRLLREIVDKSPEDGVPYITLFADEPGRKLYRKNGFVEAAPKQLGMALPPGSIPPRSQQPDSSSTPSSTVTPNGSL